jgi:hypothetical protein
MCECARFLGPVREAHAPQPMLTHTDVHYLAGLLQIVTSPRPVHVELGSMVLDDAAATERDVDVTVRCVPAEEQPSLLVGIEVKDHAKPLNVIHVEQLSAKLADMSSLGKRGIVSASGYSGPAIRKARARDVRLYTLSMWDTRDDLFSANLAAVTVMRERTPRWENATIRFNPDVPANCDLGRALENNCLLVGKDGAALTDLPNRKSLVDLVVQQTLDALRIEEGFSDLSAGIRVPKTLNIHLPEDLYVQLPSGLEPLASAQMSGQVYWHEDRHALEFRRLVDVTDGMKPPPRCARRPCCAGRGGTLYGPTPCQMAVVSP